jgi:2-oxoglutarate ferredoxin oxidoreductase subunit delta
MAKIEIHSENCKACLYCVQVCPNKVIAEGTKVNSKGYMYVVPVNIEKCVGCKLCAIMCPDAAIDVYK